MIGNKICVVEYEPDSELRDTETVPLTEPGGIEAFVRREVLPHVPDAWIDKNKTAIGYEISFARYFYKPQPLRTLPSMPLTRTSHPAALPIAARSASPRQCTPSSASPTLPRTS